jgi:ankyrin repeat protein
MTIFEAIESGDVERVRALVSADPELAGARGADGVSALLQARYRFRLDLVEALLEPGPELDVFEAAALGRTDRLRELVTADPGLGRAWSPDGFTPLHLAAFFGHEEGARLLIEHGSDVNAVARNTMAVQPLHSAAAAGQGGIARALLEAGADPNARQESGFVPLHAAAQNGDFELARLLLEHGADRAARTDDGRTAADVAAAAGHAELAGTLRR